MVIISSIFMKVDIIMQDKIQKHAIVVRVIFQGFVKAGYYLRSYLFRVGV